jgi:hypothetical protein
MWEWSRTNRRLSISILALLTLFLVYGITQTTIVLVNGPDAKISEYAAALQQGDFTALDDHSLFPNGDSSGVPPEIVAARSTNGSPATVEGHQTSRLWLEATALVSQSQTESIPIRLVAETEWNWGLQFPVWSVVSKAPVVHFAISESLNENQSYSFGNPDATTQVTSSVAALRTISAAPVSVLPGTYLSTLLPFGFVEEKLLTSQFWEAGASEKIPLVVPELNVSARAADALLSTANALTVNCSDSACGALGSNTDVDFNLWSKYPYTVQHGTSFDVSFSPNACTRNSATLDSPTQITATFVCSVTASAHLYVKYIYYQGYYSTYWYNYDYYDNKTRTVYPEVTIVIDPATGAIGVSAAAL